MLRVSSAALWKSTWTIGGDQDRGKRNVGNMRSSKARPSESIHRPHRLLGFERLSGFESNTNRTQNRITITVPTTQRIPAGGY